MKPAVTALSVSSNSTLVCAYVPRPTAFFLGFLLFSFAPPSVRTGKNLVLLERELLVLGTILSDDVDVNKIASVDVALSSRREDILDELQSLFNISAKMDIGM
jgi:hypothetical protein